MKRYYIRMTGVSSPLRANESPPNWAQWAPCQYTEHLKIETWSTFSVHDLNLTNLVSYSKLCHYSLKFWTILFITGLHLIIWIFDKYLKMLWSLFAHLKAKCLDWFNCKQVGTSSGAKMKYKKSKCKQVLYGKLSTKRIDSPQGFCSEMNCRPSKKSKTCQNQSKKSKYK